MTAKTAAKTATAKKVATKKPVAKKVATKTLAPVVVANVIRDALIARRDACIKHDLNVQAKQLNTPITRMTDAVMTAAKERLTQTDFEALAKTISYTDATGKGIEQVKSIVKIATMFNALACGLKSALDNNSLIGIRALLENDNRATVREMIVSQSRVANENRDLFSVRDTVKNLARYSVGTGCSQTSQVRQVLNNFGFFESGSFVKGAKNNEPVLNGYGVSVLSSLINA